MMKFLLVLFVFIFFSFSSKAELELMESPIVTYFDENNNQKVTDWLVQFFPVWKTEDGEKQLFVQTWLVLPPMLDLQVTDGHGVILDNTKENKSPFFNNKDIKKVLKFETEDSLHVVSLKKINSLDPDHSKTVKIKVSFPTTTSFVRRSIACRESGHNIETKNLKVKPFIMFLDCSTTKNGHLKVKVSPESEVSNKQLLINGKTKNRTPQQLDYDFQKMKKNADSPIAISELIINRTDLNQKSVAKITYQNGQTMKMTTPEDEADDVDTATPAPINDSALSIENQNQVMEKRDPRYIAKMAGLVSRTGAEFYFSMDYIPKTIPGIYKLTLISPFQYFSNNRKEKIYFDGQLTYINTYHFFSYGAGIEFIHLLSPSLIDNRTAAVAGPNIRLQLDNFSNEQDRWRANVSYAHLAKVRGNHSWNGYRLASEIGFAFYITENSVWEFLLMHSSLDLKHSLEVYKDHKFLGGVLYQW